MDLNLYLYFLITSALLIIIPGPNVLVIVSTSISHGRLRGLQTVAGTSAAMVIQLAIAAISTASIINLLNQGFLLLKYLGAFYLLYLGFKHLLIALKPQTSIEPISGSGSFIRGFFVSLTNPKTIIFFAAFLPQFVSTSSAVLPQLIVLSLSFWLIALILDSCFALLAGSFTTLLRRRLVHRLSNGFSGTFYVIAGIWLALSRRSV